MAGEMTSFDVTWRYYQHKWYRPVEQAQGYPINVNLFRPALTERKPCKREGRGRGSIYLTPLYHGGGMG